MACCSRRCNSTARLDGRTAIITGSNTGIGKYTAMDFYRRGAKVLMACRNMTKADAAMQDILEKCKNEENLGQLSTIELNLASLKSVRDCSDKILQSVQQIDLLINNAGVMVCPFGRTVDGFEMHLGSNHLGHFLFTLLLLPKIRLSPAARIVNVSSLAHELGSIDFNDLNWEKRSYSAAFAYQQSKLCNVLFTKELARKLKEAKLSNITTYALHPGVIDTELGRHLGETYCFIAGWFWKNIGAWFIKSAEQGAQTTLYCALDEQTGKESGLYYTECLKCTPSQSALNPEYAKRLWEESLKMVGLPSDYNPFE